MTEFTLTRSDDQRLWLGLDSKKQLAPTPTVEILPFVGAIRHRDGRHPPLESDLVNWANRFIQAIYKCHHDRGEDGIKIGTEKHNKRPQHAVRVEVGASVFLTVIEADPVAYYPHSALIGTGERVYELAKAKGDGVGTVFNITEDLLWETNHPAWLSLEDIKQTLERCFPTPETNLCIPGWTRHCPSLRYLRFVEDDDGLVLRLTFREDWIIRLSEDASDSSIAPYEMGFVLPNKDTFFSPVSLSQEHLT